MDELTLPRDLTKASPVELRRSLRLAGGETLAAVREEIRARLRPPSGEWLAGRVAVLLGHFYDPNESEAEALMRAEDWLDALSGISQEAVAAACRSYLRENTRARPTPGVIRERAIAHERAYREALEDADARAKAARLAMLPKPTPDEEAAQRERSRQARAATIADLARKFPSIVKPIPKAGD